MEEKWKPVVGYEDSYEVSSAGRVRSKIRKTRINDTDDYVLRQKYDTHGYKRVNLYKDRTAKSLLVSRLVAEAFIPNPDELPMVGHDDDIKTNNYVENLYWTDSLENNNHNDKMRNFQQKHRDSMDVIAEKLSTPVIGTDIETSEKIYFCSMQEAARHGFDQGKISACCSGKRSKHKGYTWRKDDDFR